MLTEKNCPNLSNGGHELGLALNRQNFHNKQKLFFLSKETKATKRFKSS